MTAATLPGTSFELRVIQAKSDCERLKQAVAQVIVGQEEVVEEVLWALVAGGHVIIDRSDHASSVRSLERAAARVRNGTTVVIFPEGTRQPSGKLGEFKSGGFHLALAAQVPILPVSVSGSSRITPPHSLRIESGRIQVRYGEPIPTAGLGLEDRQRLKELTRAAIMAGFEPEPDRVPTSLTLPEPRGYPEHASRPRG